MARREKEKKTHVGLIFYLLLLVVLGFIIYKASGMVWDICEEYQANSATTVMEQTVAKLRADTGLDIGYSPIPTIDENGDSTYILKIDKTPVGKAQLHIKKKILTLALFELKGYEGTRSYEFYAPEGVTVKACGQPVEPVSEHHYFADDYLQMFQDDRKISGFYRYKVEGVFDFSQIEISCEDYELTESVQSRLDPIPFYEKRFPPEVEADIKARARTAAQLYSNYISLDAKWAKLEAEIMADSYLLYTIPSLEVQWFNAHDRWDMVDVSISRPLCINDRYALLHISYNYVITRGRTINNFPTSLAFYMHLDSDGIWRLADMSPNPMYDFEMYPME